MADVLPSFFSLRLSCHSRTPLVASVSSASIQSRRLRRAAVSVVIRPKRNTRFAGLVTHAVIAEDDAPKWWEKSVENMIDVHSIEEFLQVLNEANDKLVVVEFYGTWCGSCRALFPKLCKIAEEHPDIVFAKVNFDENKPMCKRLNVRVLPFFHFYRGADGRLDSFSCSFAKFKKVKDAIATHNTARCSIGPPTGVGDIDLLKDAIPKEKPANATR